MNLNSAPEDLIAELDAGMMVAVPLHDPVLEAAMCRAHSNLTYFTLDPIPRGTNPAGLEKVGEKHGS